MSSRIFLISGLVVSGFFVGFSVANIVYYARLRNAKCSAITSGEATSMLIINIILFIIALIIFIWTIWELIISGRTKEKIVQYFTSPPGTPNPFTNAAGQVEAEPTGESRRYGAVYTPRRTRYPIQQRS